MGTVDCVRATILIKMYFSVEDTLNSQNPSFVTGTEKVKGQWERPHLLRQAFVWF